MIVGGSVVRLLRSQALAVFLILAIAAVAAVSSLLRAPDAPGAWTFRELVRPGFSPLFSVLVLAAVANVIACTLYRRGWRAGAGGLRAWTDVAMHAAVVLVLAGGAIKGAFGSIGTQNIALGSATSTTYNWKTGRDEPLGFDLQIAGLREERYPARIRLGVWAAGTGEKVALLELVEGAPRDVPGAGLEVLLKGYAPETRTITFLAQAGARREELVLAADGGGASEEEAFGFRFSLVAWRSDLKTVRARVVLKERGVTIHERALGPNEGLRFRGTSLFMTAWGADDFGTPFCGIQAVRDPGAPVFWVGCVLLALAVPLHLAVKARRSPTASAADPG